MDEIWKCKKDEHQSEETSASDSEFDFENFLTKKEFIRFLHVTYDAFVPPDFVTHDVTSENIPLPTHTKAYGASWDYQIGEILNANTAAWSGLDKRKIV